MNKIEKDPFRIIYKSKGQILPKSVWYLYFFLLFILFILDFVIPNKVIEINLQMWNANQYIIISLSALAFILSMYMFGREVYSVEDFARIYLKNPSTYYGYLSDYLFPSLIWGIIVIISILRIMIKNQLPFWLLEFLRLVFISLVVLAFLATITLVIHNMNRVSNKILIESEKIRKETEK